MVLSGVWSAQARLLALRGIAQAAREAPADPARLDPAASNAGERLRRRLTPALSTPRPIAPIPTSPTSTLTTPEVGIHKIQHVIVIMQENRSFDSYFGTYSGADGIPMQNGLPTVCVPDPPGACVRPFHDRHDENAGGPHSQVNAIADIDGGRMDGFVEQQRSGLLSCQSAFNPACGNASGPPDVMGYHTGRRSRTTGPTRAVRAPGPHVRAERLLEPPRPPVHGLRMVGALHTPRRPDQLRQRGPESGHPPTSCAGRRPQPGGSDYAWTDLTYLLHKQGVSWGYYVFNGTEPDCDDDAAMSCAPHAPGGQDTRDLEPTAVLRHRPAGRSARQHPVADRLLHGSQGGHAAGGVLDRPRTDAYRASASLITAGQTYVTSLINAVMRSPEWDSTAIFLTWDDWGGFYDHVSAAAGRQNGYGLRVPGLVISPYARRGFIDHQVSASTPTSSSSRTISWAGSVLTPPRTDARTRVRTCARTPPSSATSRTISTSLRRRSRRSSCPSIRRPT